MLPFTRKVKIRGVRRIPFAAYESLAYDLVRKTRLSKSQADAHKKINDKTISICMCVNEHSHYLKNESKSGSVTAGGHENPTEDEFW